MESAFFMLRFRICTRGVAFKLKVCFFVFLGNGGFWKELVNLLWIDYFYFKSFDLKIKILEND